MNLIASSFIEASGPATDVAVSPPRQWSTEPDGPNDRPVDIYWNGSWIPAHFSDIKKGDFYLLLDVELDPTKCFYAASNCTRTVPQNRYSWKEEPPSFIIRSGSEIVQAPAMKDINPALTNETHLLLKE